MAHVQAGAGSMQSIPSQGCTPLRPSYVTDLRSNSLQGNTKVAPADNNTTRKVYLPLRLSIRCSAQAWIPQSALYAMHAYLVHPTDRLHKRQRISCGPRHLNIAACNPAIGLVLPQDISARQIQLSCVQTIVMGLENGYGCTVNGVHPSSLQHFPCNCTSHFLFPGRNLCHE